MDRGEKIDTQASDYATVTSALAGAEVNGGGHLTDGS